MKKKPVLYSELCYIFGIVSLALGASLMVRADFGVSVVVSPSYLLHLRLSQIWPAFSFGVSEYVVQGTLLLLLIVLVRRFHWSYLFSFATALLYGFVLDCVLWLLAFFALDVFALRLFLYLLGLLLCAFGVSFVLHSYISPEVYELLIRELSARHSWNIGKLKTAYDIISCLVAISLSFLFFGFPHLRGVGIGTVLCALCCGALVALFGRFLEACFELRPAFPQLERFFTPPPFPANKTSKSTPHVSL